MNNLSLRLSTIASLVPKGAFVCDVGTDHGFLPIFLMESGKARGVIATDINEKPLKKAKENLKKTGTEGITLRLCDGLSGIKKGDADTVIIAGMGGEVISGILERNSEITENADITIILQPTTSPEFLRKYLYETGYEIIKEIPVEEKGKLYSVMLVKFQGNPQKKEDWVYYVGLVDPKDQTGRKYIEKQKLRAYKCMQALENIGKKQQEFKFHKEIYDNLWRLTEDSYTKS